MSLREQMEHQALAARRDMVRKRELLSEDDFRRLARLSARRLKAMLATGSLFTVEVDGVGYLPSLLITTDVDRARLYSICRILVPAPPSCRLDYLESRQENLGGISPIEALRGNGSYQLLRCMASAYAVQWFRTAVTIYEGIYSTEPADVEAVLIAATEADPRSNVWKRAETAILVGGYRSSPRPYPYSNHISVFIVLRPAGQFKSTVEARITATLDGEATRAVVYRDRAMSYRLETVRVGRNTGIVRIVTRVMQAARAYEIALTAKRTRTNRN